MAKLAAADSAKILMLGNGGAGKTGTLASLAAAGYKVNILDFDNGTEILYHTLKKNPEALGRVDVEKCIDQFKMGADKSIKWVTPLKAFPHALKCLDEWPDQGKPSEWGTDTVLVLDSLTFLGDAIFRYVLAANGKVGYSTDPKAGATEPNWGSAINLQEDFLALLTSNLKCHVIVMAHLKDVERGGVNIPMPSALGKKLPPSVSTYFNHALLVQSKGTGANAKRSIYTNTQGLIELKTAAPGLVNAEYPIETGLADYFKALFGPLK